MSLHADQIVHLPASPLRAAARWALHQLKIYTLAAVGGGAIFMVWLGAYLFFSSSPHETQIQKPVSAPLPQTSAPTAPLISSLPANLLVGTPVFDARQMFIGRVENISHQMDDKTFDVVIKLHSDTLAQQFLAVPMSSVKSSTLTLAGSNRRRRLARKICGPLVF